MAQAYPFAVEWNLTGQPSISVPVGQERRRPPDRHAARGPPRRGGDAARARRAARGRAALDGPSAASRLSSLPPVRQLRIQDTLQRRGRSGRAERARSRRHLRLRPDRLRAHPRGQRAPVHRLLAAQALPRARGLRRVARHQHHRRERQDLRRRPRARRSERGARARDDRRLRRGHRRARPRPARPRAEGHRDDRRDHRPDRGARGVGSRLRARAATSTSGSPVLPRLRQALEPPARGDAAGRGRRCRRAEGVAAGLRALEGAQGGRGHLVGVALGRGPAGLAHRVLGHGRGRAGRRRSSCTAAARTSSSRTTRTRSLRPRRRAASRWRAPGCTTAWCRWATRRWPSRWATSGCCTALSSSSGATRS